MPEVPHEWCADSPTPTDADSFTCPGCGAIIPEHLRKLPEVHCPGCGAWELSTGILALSTTEEVEYLQVQAPEWYPVPPSWPGRAVHEGVAQAVSHSPDSDSAWTAAPSSKKQKRSTERGEARDKLVGALTKHHQYADGGCLNLEPIGNNELAKVAGVSASTASAFFSNQFKGHTKYKALCRDSGRLTAALKLLNNEFSPHDLYGRRPAGEDDRDDEGDE